MHKHFGKSLHDSLFKSKLIQNMNKTVFKHIV